MGSRSHTHLLRGPFSLPGLLPASPRPAPPHARLLLNAAQRGLPGKAEEVFKTMMQAGIEPGARAYHVLIFAYVRCKEAARALDVARRVTEAGEEGGAGWDVPGGARRVTDVGEEGGAGCGVCRV